MPSFNIRQPLWAIRRRRRLLIGFLALEIVVIVGLVTAIFIRVGDDSDEFIALETLLSQEDLPAGWVPVDAATYPYMTNSPLLRLLLEDETVAGAFSAFRDPENTSAVATYVVFRPEAPPLLQNEGDDSSLGELAPLVIELERLARQQLGGALPEVFFATTDEPTPGSLRGRSLTPAPEHGVQSESILFTTGPVLALVVVEHPQGEEPFRPVEELAQIVLRRIEQQLD